MKRNINLLYGFAFFDQFMIVIALWVPYLATQGIGMRQFMELQAVFGVVILCGEVPSGLLSDLWGRKKTLLLGATLKALSFSSLPLWSSYEGLLFYHVDARNPVLDRLRRPAPSAGPSRSGSAPGSRTPAFIMIPGVAVRDGRDTRGDASMNTSKGFVVPAGGGKHLDMSAPGRFAALKLLGDETNGSIMLFEETLPVGTKSLFHRHSDSDEVAWVLAGEITFKIGDEVSVGGPGTCAFFPRDVPHAWKSTGRESGRVLFLYIPAAAGGYVEELAKRPAGSLDSGEYKTLREHYRWEVIGPNPL